jgi:hypothetical protein
MKVDRLCGLVLAEGNDSHEQQQERSPLQPRLYEQRLGADAQRSHDNRSCPQSGASPVWNPSTLNMKYFKHT